MEDIIKKYKRKLLVDNIGIIALSLVLGISWVMIFQEDQNMIKWSLIDAEQVTNNSFVAAKEMKNVDKIIMNLYSEKDLMIESDYNFSENSSKENYTEVYFDVMVEDIKSGTQIFKTENDFEVITSYFIDWNWITYKIK